ncbi:MAG: hypothetical protein ACRDVG_07145 [Jatrophihabitantaceae bacterium]
MGCDGKRDRRFELICCRRHLLIEARHGERATWHPLMPRSARLKIPLVSLIAQAERLPADAVHQAREHELTWTQIGQLLNLAPSTAARRFRNTP